MNSDDEERKRIAAEESINRYTRFHERCAANEESSKKSVSNLEELKGGKLQKISYNQQVFVDDMKYISEAWEQIIECRRVMKRAYAYGYYIEEKPKKHFLEFILRDAERALEGLHQCAEEEVRRHADADGPLPNFIELKEKLTTMTIVTRNYFDKVVKVLENGLEDGGWVDVTLGEVDFDFLEEGLDGNYWMCSRCKLFNGLDRLACDACLHPRPL